MTVDRFDLPVTTPSARALALYIEGIDLLLSANAGAEARFREALAIDPDFALAHIALARNAQLYGRMGEARTVAARAVECCARSGAPRERGHVEALALAINGMPEQALAALMVHLRGFPRDGLALSMALGVYGLIAFSGRPDHHEAQRALLESLAPHWGEDWWFLGYLGWSHVETCDPSGGAEILERALALNPRNAHGVHARTHARVELGQASAGVAFLEAWLPAYDPSAQLHCHLNWHLALFELDLGAPERAFARYISTMRPGIAQCAPLATLADAASFLWRCGLYGVDPKDPPWSEVAALAEQSFPRAGLAFADLHAAMASAACGDSAGLERRIDTLGKLDSERKLPQGAVIPSLCRGLGSYARGDYEEAATILDAAMTDLTRVAGSHAQREVFEDTLIAACLKCGRTERARGLLAVRLGRRPRAQDSRWLKIAT
jgi:tetratricopeptide (TPR) repeat protein